jgi:hypothetical protein
VTAQPVEHAHSGRRKRRRTPASTSLPGLTSVGPAPEAAPDVTFEALGVPAPLVGVLAGAGIVTPFPIQAAVLPDALAGRDRPR